MPHIVLYFRATNKVNPASDTCRLTSDARSLALNTADFKTRDRIIAMKSTEVRNEEVLCQLDGQQQNYVSVPGIQIAK